MENINNIKSNIIDDLFTKQAKRRHMRKEGSIIGIIIVLIIIVFLQGMELGRLRGYVQAADGTNTPINNLQAPSPVTPAPSVGLPSQVGGC